MSSSKVAVALLLALSLSLISNTLADAQTTAIFSACTLNRTMYVTMGGHPGYAGSASCGTSGCIATGQLLPYWNVTCPLAAGGVCTFAMDVVTSYTLTQGDLGFLNATGMGIPLNDNGNFALLDDRGIGSAILLGQAKNTVANQTYKLQPWISCADQTGDGCRISTGGGGMYTRAATARISVYTGCYKKIYSGF